MNEISLNDIVYDFSVDQSAIEKEDKLNIHEYFMKKQYKIMFKFIKQAYIVILVF